MLQASLVENNTQMEQELAEILNADQSVVSSRLHGMEMADTFGNWIPHELTERQMEYRKITCERLIERQQGNGFLHSLVTEDEKQIHYENSKREKAWIQSGEAGPSEPK
ncbi:hypothetical protein Trydic_g2795 [Trypoxylus dichotomus]